MADEIAWQAVNVIAKTAQTGKIGDGKVFILPLDEIIRIRAGESGEHAVKARRPRPGAPWPFFTGGRIRRCGRRRTGRG